MSYRNDLRTYTEENLVLRDLLKPLHQEWPPNRGQWDAFMQEVSKLYTARLEEAVKNTLRGRI